MRLPSRARTFQAARQLESRPYEARARPASREAAMRHIQTAEPNRFRSMQIDAFRTYSRIPRACSFAPASAAPASGTPLPVVSWRIDYTSASESMARVNGNSNGVGMLSARTSDVSAHGTMASVTYGSGSRDAPQGARPCLRNDGGSRSRRGKGRARREGVLFLRPRLCRKISRHAG